MKKHMQTADLVAIATSLGIYYDTSADNKMVRIVDGSIGEILSQIITMAGYDVTYYLDDDGLGYFELF